MIEFYSLEFYKFGFIFNFESEIHYLFYYSIRFVKSDQRPVQIRDRGQSSSPPHQPLQAAATSPQQLSSFGARGTFSPPSVSNTYTNVLSPIFSHLATKYRSQSATHVDLAIDELKAAFLQLEQQNPGACDLFIKYIFQCLKSTNQIWVKEKPETLIHFFQEVLFFVSFLSDRLIMWQQC